MRVRRIDINGDWTFGQGSLNYAKDDEAVAQNVRTRLKSFKNDWFLDVSANIDWFTLFGNRNNSETILSEVRRVCKATYGVQAVNSIELKSNEDLREASISVSLITIFGRLINESIEVSHG